MSVSDRLTPVVDGKRPKIFRLSPSVLLDFMKHGVSEGFEPSANRIPDDATLAGMQINRSGEIELLLESNEFAPIAVGEEIPEAEAPTYRRTRPEATEPRCWICGRPATRFALNASRTEFSDPCCEDHRPERARL